ncbi:hydroxyethylthiazole kinase [Aurantimonas sp. A3-2-R12]|uniref:hydroxyethylthiazole kinase n=1 Tax=Aurantimonas sp. A3-2-R12 TaxID=3114362 RepID=UPI002E17DCCE|nr:hydroxyethylthiazole kinase [Aurantimonas sp. A3-2-R12]
MTVHPVIEAAARLLGEVRERRPKVHCLTNSVVQKFTADGLSALGAVPSMTSSLDEVADFARQADALLVNLGTLDPGRREAIMLGLDTFETTGRPWALDPVHCELSPLRLAFARQLLARGPAVTRGNAKEIAVLGEAPPGTIVIQTGASDLVRLAGRELAIRNGHPLMAAVTGTGCLSGALIASFLALGQDRLTGAASALLFLGVAAEIAAETARGPGTFAAALLDAVANATPADVMERGRVDDGAA